MNGAIRVVLAEDHTIVRAGLRAYLANLPHVAVVAEARDGREVLELVQEHRPDVVMMDLSMPGLNGLEATCRVKRQYANVRVLVLSVHSNRGHVLEALRAGAEGYLTKDSGTAEIEVALTAVSNGRTYLSPTISQHVVNEQLRRPAEEDTAETAFDLLTPRQREVLQLIAEGHTTRDIALILGVSVKTVETHRARLMQRLEIYDVPGLVRYAVGQGLVDVE